MPQKLVCFSHHIKLSFTLKSMPPHGAKEREKKKYIYWFFFKKKKKKSSAYLPFFGCWRNCLYITAGPSVVLIRGCFFCFNKANYDMSELDKAGFDDIMCLSNLKHHWRSRPHFEHMIKGTAWDGQECQQGHTPGQNYQIIFFSCS